MLLIDWERHAGCAGQAKLPAGDVHFRRRRGLPQRELLPWNEQVGREDKQDIDAQQRAEYRQLFACIYGSSPLHRESGIRESGIR